MHTRTQPRSLIGSFLIFLLSALAPARAQVTTDSNAHYLDYNGATTVLIGMSSEYLPHVTRPGQQGSLCTWESYLTCLNDLQAKGLNKMQLWVSLNSSIGLQDCNTINTLNPNSTVAVPYNYEQPFFWNGAKWRLDRYEPNFWSRLNQVITDAGTRGIVVEVTLFDPWDGLVSGTNPASPWNANNNIVVSPPPGCSGTAGFSDIRYLVSYDNGTTDNQLANQCARVQQMNLVQAVAQQINNHDNFYWNLGNEVDLVPSGFNAPDPAALIHWLNAVALKIASVEGSVSYPKTHLMAVNLTNQATLTDAWNPNVSLRVPLDSHISIIDGHYVLFHNSGSVGAMPLIKSNITTTPTPLAFGFNESRSTPCPNITGARAEAWEFVCDQGATYDNYNLSWNDTNTGTIQSWLSSLKSFLSPFTLTNFGVQTGTTPAWAPGLPAYGTADGTGTNFYWSAMQWTRNQYALYMHHSTVTTANAARYAPPATCQSPGFQTAMSLSLGNTSGHFNAEWIFPSTGAVACSQDVNYVAGTPVPVTSPRYRYDLALRVTHCSGSGACAPVQSCSSTPADACPPADPATCPVAPHPHCPTPGVTSSCPYAVPSPCQN